jgi:hypothetical protein
MTPDAKHAMISEHLGSVTPNILDITNSDDEQGEEGEGHSEAATEVISILDDSDDDDIIECREEVVHLKIPPLNEDDATHHEEEEEEEVAKTHTATKAAKKKSKVKQPLDLGGNEGEEGEDADTLDDMLRAPNYTEVDRALNIIILEDFDDDDDDDDDGNNRESEVEAVLPLCLKLRALGHLLDRFTNELYKSEKLVTKEKSDFFMCLFVLTSISILYLTPFAYNTCPTILHVILINRKMAWTKIP